MDPAAWHAATMRALQIQSLTGPPGVVVRWPNHDDHLHVRFPDPDG